MSFKKFTKEKYKELKNKKQKNQPSASTVEYKAVLALKKKKVLHESAMHHQCIDNIKKLKK